MNNDLLDPILQDLVLTAYVEIIEELFLPLCDLVLLVYEVIHVLEVLVNVELFPKHRGVFHRKRRDRQAEFIPQLVNDLHPVAEDLSRWRISD